MEIQDMNGIIQDLNGNTTFKWKYKVRIEIKYSKESITLKRKYKIRMEIKYSKKNTTFKRKYNIRYWK